MTKFVIYGAGKRGKWAIDVLGVMRVSAIIDKNREIQNTYYKGIPIISIEQYLNEYSDCPILITPMGLEEKIKDFLKEKGIYNTFCFMDELPAIEGFLLQAPIDHLIKKFRRGKIIYIYGYCAFGLILYDTLFSKGFNCKLVVQSLYLRELKRLKKDLNAYDIEGIEDINSPGTLVLLADKISDFDYAILRKKNTRIEEYYNLGIRQNLYYNPQIEKFKDIHRGERGFVIATGPSLRLEDLEMLYMKKEICISLNGIFKIFSDTLWRPDYYVISDPSGMRMWKKDILSMNVKAKFISDIAWQFEDEEISDNLFKWHFIREWKEGKMPQFSSDFAKGAYFGYTVAYEGGLQLATYMGFQEIYLLGTDCCQYSDPKKQHFVPNYNVEVSNLKIDKITLSYQSANEYANLHGIKIYNATRGGNLEVFKRVNFDNLF